MSTEFLSIQECISAQKGSFIGTVSKESALSAGTGSNGDWTKKIFTLSDTTGEIEITAWNDETSKIKVGNVYEFVGCWWKEYKGNIQLGFGQFCEIKQVGTTQKKDVGQQVIENVEKIAIPASEPAAVPLPSNPSVDTFAQSESILMLQIESNVRKIFDEYGGGTNDQKVGMWVKSIYHESKKVSFVKAGDGFSAP